MNIASKPRFVGIDVGKFELVLAVHGENSPLTFANTVDGIAALIVQLSCSPDPVHIALEATGGYEWPLWEALEAAGLDVRQVPPGAARAGPRLCTRLWRAGKNRPDRCPVSGRVPCVPARGRAQAARRILAPYQGLGDRAPPARHSQDPASGTA